MAESQYPLLKPVGEDALLVEFEPEIGLEVNRKVRQLAFALEKAALPGISEIIPAYRSLIVYFDPSRLELTDLHSSVETSLKGAEPAELPAARLFRVPTVYGGEHGPDLPHVAATANTTPENVVEQFAKLQYPVYFLGFLCSLPYLGGVPELLHLPRRAAPRTRVPAGSVGIAGGQAVVLPTEMPSGFHYIGRTPVAFYDPARMPPTTIRPGDLVEFPAVKAAEAQQWSGRWLGDCLA
jgi:KipI family sensor histidine kinase inhibitor